MNASPQTEAAISLAALMRYALYSTTYASPLMVRAIVRRPARVSTAVYRRRERLIPAAVSRRTRKELAVFAMTAEYGPIIALRCLMRK